MPLQTCVFNVRHSTISPLPFQRERMKVRDFLLRRLVHWNESMRLSAPHLSPLLIAPLLALTGASRPYLSIGRESRRGGGLLFAADIASAL
ncbi:MAG: hypothetical protein DMF15_01835 [Verrucomicrobia bacterium]|nr:MAG: hypothetical protein DMF15_01835 [Verrucomicrobiota bacterium]